VGDTRSSGDRPERDLVVAVVAEVVEAGVE
jgi:hypothetical protein